MLRLALPLVLILPAVADASLCNLEPVTLDVPVSCTLVAYNRAATPVPRIIVLRGEQPVAVEPAVTRTTRVEIAVEYSDVCAGEIVHETRDEEYDIVEIELPGVQVGDLLLIEGQGQRGAIVDAAEQCRTQPEWPPWCNSSGEIDCTAHETEQDDAHEADNDDGGGCNAGGATGGLGLALAAMLARRSGRRSR